MAEKQKAEDFHVPATLGWVAGGSMLAVLSVLCCFADAVMFFAFHSVLRFAAPIILTLACGCSIVAGVNLGRHFHWLGAFLLSCTVLFQGVLVWAAIRYGGELFSK